ncbi:MAG: translation elongation factor Ts, partial [Gammaproteobacteria bacterium]
MAITASLVKELRERTGSGMMECKKALVETDGDIEAAAELMRKSGAAKADKKAGRVAADGAIKVAVSDDGKSAVILEINSETDFVAKDDNFQAFADEVLAAVAANQPATVEELASMQLASGQTVEEARQALISKVGENIQVRRFQIVETDASIASYLHGARIGVLVDS